MRSKISLFISPSFSSSSSQIFLLFLPQILIPFFSKGLRKNATVDLSSFFSKRNQWSQTRRRRASPTRSTRWAAWCRARRVRGTRTTCRPDPCPRTRARRRAPFTRSKDSGRITATTSRRPASCPASFTPSCTGTSSRIRRAPSRERWRTVAAWGRRKWDRTTTCGGLIKIQEKKNSFVVRSWVGRIFREGKKKRNNISWITIYYWIAWGERTVIGGVVTRGVLLFERREKEKKKRKERTSY